MARRVLRLALLYVLIVLLAPSDADGTALGVTARPRPAFAASMDIRAVPRDLCAAIAM
jgi:hypothetical protein